jgi:hypothetical protein
MLNLGTIELPVEAATKTFAILAKRGAGKSYTGAVMAEEFYKNGVPFVVFDPIDVWWGLRFKKDGKSRGLPIVVFGVLDNADIPLDKDMGAKIAQAVTKSNISCIISTFGMPKNGQRKLITEFSEELLRINNTPRHIFIEEAHEFVPQRVTGDMGKTFNAVSNLVVMGRNRGLGVTLINQRAATINKDVLTQLDTLLAFRNVSPQDRAALRDWVEYHSADGDFNEFMSSLPSLPTGEGWIWSPEFLEIFKRIKIRERETFHPDREKLGTNFVMPDLERADVEKFVEDFLTNGADYIEVPARIIERDSKPKESTHDQIEAVKAHYEEQITQIEKEHEEKEYFLTQEIDGLKHRLREILDISSKTLGEEGVDLAKGESRTVITSLGKVDLWVNKVGKNSGAGRILQFLAEKHPMKYTKSQVLIAAGLRNSRGGATFYALKTLKQNNLIKEEGGMLSVNEDLL